MPPVKSADRRTTVLTGAVVLTELARQAAELQHPAPAAETFEPAARGQIRAAAVADPRVWNDEWNYLGGSVIDPMILCPVHINVVQWPCSRVARLCDRPFLLENSKAWSAAKDDET